MGRTPTGAVRPLPLSGPVGETADMDQPAARPGPRRLPTVVAVTGAALVVLAVGSMLARGRSAEVLYARWLFHNAPTALVVLWLGWALDRREPGHGLARMFLLAGAASALHVASICVADWRFVADGVGTAADLRFVPADLPWSTSVPFWFSTWLWAIPAGMLGTLLLLLFPDGRLPSPRWRPLVGAVAVGITLVAAAYAVASWPTSPTPIRLNEQFAQDEVVPRTLGAFGLALLSIGTAGSVASLVVRWRRAGADERQQLRPVVVVGSVTAVGLVALWPWQWLWVPAVLVLLFALFGTYTVSVLRYRLHDLDLAINRAVVASVLVASATLLYLVVVVAAGSLVGRRTPQPLAPLLAVGVIALLLEPTRRWVRRWVDRLLYGRDADAYEVLSELAGQLREAGGIDTIAQHVTELLVRSTGATGAELTLRAALDATSARDGQVEGEARREVDGEGGDAGPRRVASSGRRSPDGRPAVVVPVVHDGEVLGELSLHARDPADLAPDATALVTDVAATLGTVLRNAELTAALQRQVGELRLSRERLVSAHDAARQELERDLHDGAQARLVALRLQLGVAAARAATAEDPLARTLRADLERLGDDTDATIRSLRDLARGLQPPVLASHGVAAALRAGVRGLPVELAVEDRELARHRPAVEAAAYFCCLEATQNAVTHGDAGRIEVTLATQDGALRFTVCDDGCGFEPSATGRGRGLTNLRDRVDALGGHLTVDAAVGRGTCVHGELPDAALATPEADRAQPLVSDR